MNACHIIETQTNALPVKDNLFQITINSDNKILLIVVRCKLLILKRKEDKMKVVSYSNNGQVTVLINNIRYHYVIDAAKIPHVVKMQFYNRGKCLAYLRKHTSLIEKERIC